MINKTIIFFCIVGILGFLINGIMHEQVHREIYRFYGLDSTLHLFKYFPSMAVEVDDGQDLSKCTNNCILAHNINEAVAYNLQGFYILLFVALMIIITNLEVRREIE